MRRHTGKIGRRLGMDAVWFGNQQIGNPRTIQVGQSLRPVGSRSGFVRHGPEAYTEAGRRRNRSRLARQAPPTIATQATATGQLSAPWPKAMSSSVDRSGAA